MNNHTMNQLVYSLRYLLGGSFLVLITMFSMFNNTQKELEASISKLDNLHLELQPPNESSDNIITLPSPEYPSKFHKPGGLGKVIYFLEISGNNKLFPRQACAIESAVLYSGLEPVVFMISNTLNLSHNTTAQIYSTRGVTFYTLDIDKVMSGLPTYELAKTFMERTQDELTLSWLNDLVRVGIVYKFGGLYSDLDVIFLKKLDYLKDGVFYEDQLYIFDHRIQFAILPFRSGSEFLQLLMETQVQLWNKHSEKTIAGPQSLRVAYKKYMSMENVQYSVEKYSSEMVYPSKTGLGSKTSNPLLFPKRLRHKDEYWEKVIKNASAIHFLANTTKRKTINKTDIANAYSAYAPRFCPNAFNSATIF